MQNYTCLLLVPLLPLAAFIILGIGGKDRFRRSSGWIGTLCLLGSAILALFTACQYFFISGKVNGIYQKLEVLPFTWLSFSPSLSITMGLVVDPLSMLMVVIVPFISLMVHFFSMGYMKGERRYTTYFAFLGLFTFSMLGLVLSSNIFQIYIFWELVGLSSFLLIGFYYDRPSAVAAAKKAFIVTRFADLGFLIGILILAFYGGTLDFGTLIARLTQPQSPQFLAIHSASFLGWSALTWGLVLVFMGGAGKSALFPLHIWLPDAMEGPTPVSALIHAATMVVAGVYLVARLFPVFSLDAMALQIVMITGAVSAIIAAIIACTQTDIKRVLAYSTMSQIGYMMFSLGLARYNSEQGGYTASLFHLFTHAFFKSLLFLCAGAIIHLVHSNEMKDMGGLRKKMPLTHVCFLTGCLAIAGIPPFSGFFSKEAILHAAWQSQPVLYGLALFTSGLTAFYMFRLYFSVFWKTEAPSGLHRENGGAYIKIPLLVLALCSVLAGLLPFGSFVSADGNEVKEQVDLLFATGPVLVALGGIGLAALLYYRENRRPERIAANLGRLYLAASRKFYVDELYLFITKKLVFQLVGRPAAWFDRHVVDGLMNGLASATARTSARIRGLQSGKIQGYTLYFFSGLALLAIVFIYLWK